MLSLVCIARKSACDQHRANQHCPDSARGYASSYSRKKTHPTSFNM
ncbi:unnamed protein product [Staurois parvus]|uniref:Uncharacterized protein n=1 Tax=Staurois parvus TaxID=386267 RepID=A0ABN9GZT5_9NEOB|nr:unnamed protein product [Staurois parvus]